MPDKLGIPKLWNKFSWSLERYSQEDICLTEKVFTKECAFRQVTHRYDVNDWLGGCQCDALCQKFNDCCPDLDGHVTDDIVESYHHDILEALQCTSTEYSPEQSGVGFYLVSDCPRSSYHHHHYLRRHCLVDLERSLRMALHFIPLEIDSIVYRNVFCARCHGADILRAKFWELLSSAPTSPSQEDACYEHAASSREIPTISVASIQAQCNYYGFGSPPVPPFWEGAPQLHTRGRGRMGKLCLTAPAPSSMIEFSAAALTLTLRLPNDPCARAMADSLRSERGHQTRNEPRFLMKVEDGFRVISRVEELCRHCDALFLRLVSMDTLSAQFYISGLDPGYQNAQWSVFLGRLDHLNCSFFKDCEKDQPDQPDRLISPNARAIIWQTGSTLSVALLVSLLIIMRQNKGCFYAEPRRLQTFLIGSKILYFILFVLSHWLRKVACRVLAVLLHGVLLISFAYTILLSFHIFHMMWKLKNDLASLSQDHKKQKMTWKEIAYHAVTVGAGVGIMVGVFVYELVVDDTLFGMGKDEHCLTTTRRGKLYLIIVPTIVTLVVNALFTGYSVFTLYGLMVANPLIRVDIASRLLTFLGRMISFQGIQWILGLIHYVSGNEIVGLLFDITVSFEGLVIFSSLATVELRSK